MTDNEIIKALECCSKNPLNCRECGYKGRCNRIDCYDYLKRDALDLINRQQAEIERLKGWQDLLKAEKHSLIKAEAIKSIAERLKKAKQYSIERHENIVPVAVIDWIVKEMVGDTE